MAVKAFVWSTVAELKTYLGITVTDFDTVLENLLNQSAKMIENYLGRRVIDDVQDITEIQDGDPDNEGQFIIYVDSWPINAFTSLAFNTGTPSTPIWTVENVDNYTRDDEAGALYLADSFDPLNKPIPRGRQNVRIIYQGGYVNDTTNMPDDLIMALNKTAAKVFQKRKSDGIDNESVARTKITWKFELEPEVKQILDSYRRYF